MGSYKNYTGTYYALGFDMTSYARQRYGADIWDKSTSRYIRNLLFEGSFKHYTGSSFKRLQHDPFDFLRAEWEEQDTCTQSPQRDLYLLSIPITHQRFYSDCRKVGIERYQLFSDHQ